jgi:hypothetical protein
MSAVSPSGPGAPGFAPAESSALVVAALPFVAASDRGVMPDGV